MASNDFPLTKAPWKEFSFFEQNYGKISKVFDFVTTSLFRAKIYSKK